MFQKVLIANRGELALRILRTCKDMGLQTIAVHSVTDKNSAHVLLADESVCIGKDSPLESYLNIPAVIAAAQITHAEAIHPGVGFLAENAKFATAVLLHNMIFIGPSPEHIRTMGNKVMAKATAAQYNIPSVPGVTSVANSAKAAGEQAERLKFPVLLKAVSGGGGRGMRLVTDKRSLARAYDLASQEARVAFGCGDMYVEKYLLNPRHIEFQVLADTHGNVVCFPERDCSTQRKHQKIVEETPSPHFPVALRQKMMQKICAFIKAYGYVGAGTLEFLYDGKKLYFIEMNTRLQVEHPITEEISGVDLVKEQIHIAQGNKLSFSQEDIMVPKGHAIECRINAEDPLTFLPSPGYIEHYHMPGGIGVRVDTVAYSGYTMPSCYDSMFAKIITKGNTRDEALRRMDRALEEMVVEGIKTLCPLHRAIINHPDIVDGNYDIHWLETTLPMLKEQIS